MSTRYEFILCTQACRLAYKSDTGETICILYRLNMADFVIRKRQGTSIFASVEMLPILPMQPGNQVNGAVKGILCLEPFEHLEGSGN